jgi:hypothetical protein
MANRTCLGRGSSIVSDDASRHLASLSQEERVEEPGTGGLSKTGRSFNAKERELARRGFSPDQGD